MYLLGTADDDNCKLEGTLGCDDHELATYCQAMLQGINRSDRLKKWVAYLQHFYGVEVHRLVEAPGINHDPAAMLSSRAAKCVIFDNCDTR